MLTSLAAGPVSMGALCRVSSSALLGLYFGERAPFEWFGNTRSLDKLSVGANVRNTSGRSMLPIGFRSKVK